MRRNERRLTGKNWTLSFLAAFYTTTKTNKGQKNMERGGPPLSTDGCQGNVDVTMFDNVAIHEYEFTAAAFNAIVIVYLLLKW